jgi:CheY-like chemotaxis protein
MIGALTLCDAGTLSKVRGVVSPKQGLQCVILGLVVAQLISPLVRFFYTSHVQGNRDAPLYGLLGGVVAATLLYLHRLGQQDPTLGRTVRPRVLIVEDDSLSYQQLYRILTGRDFDVSRAATVTQALTHLEEGWAWILLDLGLPDAPGEDVLRKVRRAELPIRVCVFTGIADADRLRELKILRPDLIVVKGDPSEVDRMLGVLCEGRKGATS